MDLAKQFVPLKQNIDRKAAASLATKHGVQAIPTIVFLDARGRKQHQFVGFLPPDAFLLEMRKALKAAGRLRGGR